MGRITRTMSMILVTVLCAAAVGAIAGADTVKEHVTGKEFDASVQGATPGVTLTCTGVGCRKATALGVKVYAIAQWIDAEGARKPLSEWQGKSGKDLAEDQGFYDAISSADIEKRLRLVFVRHVTAKELRDGFGESLRLAYPEKLSSSAEQFLALFATDVKEDHSIELRCLPGGVIEVEQNGATLGRMPADPELAKAVWGIYLGKDLADSHLEQIKPELIARMDAIW